MTVPPLQKNLAGHDRHDDEPPEDWYVPPGHSSGAELPPVHRLPAGHVIPLALLPPGQYCVAGQGTVGVTVPLLGHRKPGEQARQPLRAGVFVVLMNVAGGQGVGELLPRGQ